MNRQVLRYGIQSLANLSLLVRRSLWATPRFLKEYSSPLKFYIFHELEESFRKVSDALLGMCLSVQWCSESALTCSLSLCAAARQEGRGTGR